MPRIPCDALKTLIAPACARSKEGSDHFGPYVQSFPVFLQEAIFLGLEPMGHKATALPLRQDSPSIKLKEYIGLNMESRYRATTH
jgi:hypothetical protein